MGFFLFHIKVKLFKYNILILCDFTHTNTLKIYIILDNLLLFLFCLILCFLKIRTIPTVLFLLPLFIGSQKLPPPKTNKKEKLARHGSMLALAAFATHNDVDDYPSRRLVVLCLGCVSCALCAVPRAGKCVLLFCAAPRRVSSPDHAVFPPHRTFEV